MDRTNQRSIIAIPIVLLLALGIALAGSQGGASVFGVPLFAIGVLLAFLIQWIVFVPSFINQTEKFFDLTGGITYVSVVLIAVLLNPSVDARSLLLLGMISVWAIRLGSFLFLRIRAAGEDRRFRELKVSFPRFLQHGLCRDYG